MLIRRIVYFILFIFLIWLALATRNHPQWFHPFIAKYGGDTIWAGMSFFFLRMVFVKASLWKLALIAFVLGCMLEVTQLYHGEWIESIRATKIGGILIGYGFLWSDIVCYGVGVILAVVIIYFLERKVFNSGK